MIPKILFFARDYQAKFFPMLSSDKYSSIYVTLTRTEKKFIQKKGFEVAACFEEEFDSLEAGDVPDSYLVTSYVADRFFGIFSLDERRSILAREILFWSRVLDKYKPAAVVNEVVAVEIAEVMYLEAKKRDIRYFGWMVSPFELRCFYWLSTPYVSRLEDEVYKKLPDSDSMDFAEEYYKRFNKEANIKPFYAFNLASRYNVILFVKWIILLCLNTLGSALDTRVNKYLKPYYFKKKPHLIRIANYVNSIFRSYDKVSEKDNIVFYPLHYEPEASILYMSEFNEDQAALIRNLAKCLTHNQLLVVKEHPQQPGMLLSGKFRKLRRQLSNLACLPAEYSTKGIIQISELVVTQTSTAGWEALVLGKPVVVMGKVFYDKYPRINRFCDFESLRIMIHNKQYIYPEKELTIKFIAQVWKYCQEGNPYPSSVLYREENISRIVRSIEQRMTDQGLN